MNRPRALYLGVFLVSASALVYQVAATRILSVLTWYHLAFLSITLAMLGITAAGLYVYLLAPEGGPEGSTELLVRHSLWFAASLPLCHLGLIGLRLPTTLLLEPRALAVLGLAVTLAALPFFFSGVVVAVALTRTPLPPGRVYGVDLVGAASGCLAAVALLEALDPSTICFLLGACAAVAAAAFRLAAGGAVPRLPPALALALAALAAVNGASYPGLLQIKHMHGWELPPGRVLFDRWNSHSRVVAFEQGLGEPAYWGRGTASRADQLPLVETIGLQIDGSAYTAATRFDGDPRSLGWVGHDVTSLGYRLRGRGDVAVIGVGGGRDVLTALGFGARSVVGVEVNGILTRLLARDLRGFTRLAERPDVTLVHDDGRSWLARTDRRFDLIQMSLIDTFASTAAGAMTLTENGLYTSEAWSLFLDRLRPGGILSVSRYFAPGRVSETARTTSLAVDVLLRRGAAVPAAHVMLLDAANVSTLVVSRDPFSAEDVATVRAADRLEGFSERALPGFVTPDSVLRATLEATSPEELAAATRHAVFDLEAPSDDRPFFFNMVKLSAWRRALAEDLGGAGVLAGNLRATQTLLALLVAVLLLTAATVLGPLAWRGRRHGLRPRTFVAAGSYFSLIGLGFMLVEVGLMQKFSILLGHPIYSLTVTLASLILASGLGSLSADRLAQGGRRRLEHLPALAGLLIVAGVAAAQPAIEASLAAGFGRRALVAVAFAFPIGFVLGFFFPLGLRNLRQASPVAQSWMWGLNGAFGVLGGMAAILVSMSLGIRACLLAGAACYLLLSFPARALAAQAAHERGPA